jgi:hypothetical protein
MHFLVYQNVIENEIFDSEEMRNRIGIATYIRKVEAGTKEEAIGKFILDTAAMKFEKRIEPVTCFEFDRLKVI